MSTDHPQANNAFTGKIVKVTVAQKQGASACTAGHKSGGPYAIEPGRARARPNP